MTPLDKPEGVQRRCKVDQVVVSFGGLTGGLYVFRIHIFIYRINNVFNMFNLEYCHLTRMIALAQIESLAC